ncbi:hypothetical protein [Sideroxydans lithotrophicus]|uniref:Lipoprotein n=1 Tax=Sideroxydans lithotrophicus (strain ES-1) TaxID=580332 RepID=D5CTS5_SIDLE|nr:hypothetical protein [Sideroxydans lithotrophicus]ADE12237.1 conserved hypothetical protein [Sideroxydans lithotrophicus ES-1]
MKGLRLKLAPILLSGLFVTGCQTVPVVPHALNCDVSPELLAGRCATPGPVTSDTTYAALVGIMQEDRQALRECSNAADALRDAIKRCNQAALEYNRKIDAINKTD